MGAQQLTRALLGAAAVLCTAAAPAASAQRVLRPAAAAAAPATLQVRAADGRWAGWWSAAAAPSSWTAPNPTVAGALRWRPLRAGAEWAELDLSGPGEAWRTRAVVVRIDPARQRVALAATVTPRGALGNWDVADAPNEAAVALNAGQFTDAGPWGWVVHHGREFQPAGHGPLSSALVVTRDGRARLVGADSLPALRARLAAVGGSDAGAIVEAVQSYPTLLAGDGEVPAALRVAGRGVDLEHRDARLAVGELPDGRLLVVLTRFDGLGGALARLPFGLTTPETAALLGALGARRAMLLDGGLSAQLRLRGDDAAPRDWPGLRRVPLGLVAVPR